MRVQSAGGGVTRPSSVTRIGLASTRIDPDDGSDISL